MNNSLRRAEFLPFSRPSISEAEIADVGQVLRSGWITTGPKTAQFEDVFRAYTGCGGAVAVASATGGCMSRSPRSPRSTLGRAMKSSPRPF